ncbi:hypothetical protein [Ancylobacter sp. TS-1]|uniref:hypothetical protein n=1 Tax=Ancylobacter sp. TS-1 TaxID=1850374 RepID=UPI001FEEDFC1|nr:hypothetical protein [Ancylobacter sp. TS-1]
MDRIAGRLAARITIRRRATPALRPAAPAIASRGVAYLLGAATGAVLMVPIAAAALSNGTFARLAPQPLAIEAIGPARSVPAPVVNRAAKGPRLDIAPAATSGPATPAEATDPVVDNTARAGSGTAVPPRVMRTPKGCLSSIGVTKSNLATEELTVCVADASMIERIY